MPYADFVRAIARAASLPPPRIISIPAQLLMALAPLTALVPRVPKIRVAEIRRLLEDKAFPTDEMRRLLGVTPIPLDNGLGRTFSGV